jgi:hypothetical protein
MKAINQLKTGISGIFSRLGCNRCANVRKIHANRVFDTYPDLTKAIGSTDCSVPA